MSYNTTTSYRSLAILLVAVIAAGCMVPRATSLHTAALGSSASRHAGIYATPRDYESGNLADASDCVAASKLSDQYAFRHSAFVELPVGGASVRRAKADVYGFRACDGADVRFVRGDNYRVVRAPPLYLYLHERMVLVGRSQHVVTDYAFSISPDDSVRSLTKNALKAAFPENHRFHDALDLAFRRDDELIEYDDFHHEYRVARVLRQSLP